MARGDFASAASAYGRLAVLAPENAAVWRAYGAAMHQAHDAKGAEAAFLRAVALEPRHPGGALGLGHAHRAMGDTAKAAALYRSALAVKPDLAEAWWSLAALKSLPMQPGDGAALEALTRSATAPAALFYALGRVYEDAGQDDAAFAAWTEGGRRRLLEQPYRPEADQRFAASLKQAFSETETQRLAVAEAGTPRPIFVVGLPRSGSTLVEQILASHPDVAAADEPPFLGQAAGGLGQDFPAHAHRLGASDLVKAAQGYRRALATRGGGRPVVIDKNPNNFWLIGLIVCALPDAVVIHARREPLDACVSAFKHLFPAGFAFTSTLEHLGFYHRLTSGFIADWVSRAPDRVHHFDYEALIADQEGQTRRLLGLCRLAWDPGCLAFHAMGRAVHTASAEQVTRPLYDTSIGQWRRYEKHLGPLRAALTQG